MLKKQESGSMICPGCGRLISTNAPECMHCGRKNPGLWGYGPGLQLLLGRLSLVPLIIGVCVALYLISLALDIGAILRPQGMLGFLAPSPYVLYRLGMTGSVIVAEGRWWTLVTAIYLHGGLLHILFNVLWLRQLGEMVDSLFGASRTFILFTLTGIAGFIVSVLVHVPATIGASGSIFGLLGALVFYGRKRGGDFGTAVYRQVGSWALFAFLFGMLTPAVNNFAHAGGFISGYLIAQVIGFHENSLEKSWHRNLALTLVLFTVGCFVLALTR
jgi:rhomboid protease GluP